MIMLITHFLIQLTCWVLFVLYHFLLLSLIVYWFYSLFKLDRNLSTPLFSRILLFLLVELAVKTFTTS